jgi:hypothetical protein
MELKKLDTVGQKGSRDPSREKRRFPGPPTFTQLLRHAETEWHEEQDVEKDIERTGVLLYAAEQERGRMGRQSRSPRESEGKKGEEKYPRESEQQDAVRPASDRRDARLTGWSVSRHSANGLCSKASLQTSDKFSCSLYLHSERHSGIKQASRPEGWPENFKCVEDSAEKLRPAMLDSQKEVVHCELHPRGALALDKSAFSAGIGLSRHHGNPRLPYDLG